MNLMTLIPVKGRGFALPFLSRFWFTARRLRGLQLTLRSTQILSKLRPGKTLVRILRGVERDGSVRSSVQGQVHSGHLEPSTKEEKAVSSRKKLPSVAGSRRIGLDAVAEGFLM